MELISGNEAIGARRVEAGATIGVAYPGTPSTETMETFAKQPGVYAEWCPNEKVAVEVGLGACAAGRRVLEHEARGRQRGRRPLVHRCLHGRQRRFL